MNIFNQVFPILKTWNISIMFDTRRIVISANRTLTEIGLQSPDRVAPARAAQYGHDTGSSGHSSTDWQISEIVNGIHLRQLWGMNPDERSGVSIYYLVYHLRLFLKHETWSSINHSVVLGKSTRGTDRDTTARRCRRSRWANKLDRGWPGDGDHWIRHVTALKGEHDVRSEWHTVRSSLNCSVISVQKQVVWA